VVVVVRVVVVVAVVPPSIMSRRYQEASRVLRDVLVKKKGSLKTMALAPDIENKVCR